MRPCIGPHDQNQTQIARTNSKQTNLSFTSLEGCEKTSAPNQSSRLIAFSETKRPSGKHSPDLGIDGVVTDQKLIEWYSKRQGWDAAPIATDEFIDKSKDEYNSAWLTREIAQNFVDHNQYDPGTLNGVFISEETNNGITRFVIKGNWTIEKPTGLIGLQSKKPDGQNTAGGNGIGLKQVAVRLLRDFTVKKFQIQGATWNLDYDLIKKDIVNTDLEAAGRKERIENDWLIAKMSSCSTRDDCSYIIETKDAELIQALRSIKEVGVCDENPYLDSAKALSILTKEGKGKIFWLPLTNNGEMQDGRLFINGQVMSYREKGSSPKNFWAASEGVSIQFDNMKYDMSIDRPPINSFTLEKYLAHIFKEMSDAELFEQLQASEHIWASDALKKTSNSFTAAGAVISKLVSTLRFSRSFDSKLYTHYFGNKKYLASEIGIADDQIEKLKLQGYVICPREFASIGMPKVSTALSDFDQAINAKPINSQRESKKLAEEHGFRVNHQQLQNISSAQGLFKDIQDQLGPKIKSIERKDNSSSTFRIYLDSAITVDDIFTDDLACHSQYEKENSTEGQNLLHYLRGAFFVGIKNHYLKTASLSQGEYIVTHDTSFNANRQRLMARNVACQNSEGLFIELEVNDHYIKDFESLFYGNKTDTQSNSKLDSPNDNGNTTTIYQPPNNSLTTKTILDEHLNSIEIDAGETQQLKVSGNAIKKQVRLSQEQKARAANLEKLAPGISDAIEKLDKLIPEEDTSNDSIDPRVQSYLDWRNSEHFYGQLDLDYQYLSGKSLVQIINAATQAKIDFIDAQTDSSPDIQGQINNALRTIINKVGSSETQVKDDFEIVLSPSQSQLARLTLLRNYVAYTTGYIIPNDTFLYKGTGSYGINIAKKAIGLNTALLDTPFEEAIEVLFHEVAHNKSMRHDLDFRNTLEKIISTERKVLGGIIGKIITQIPLDDVERKIAGIRDKWNSKS